MSQSAADRFHGLGAAFFPEHHPRESWEEYADLIAAAGLGFVRLGEFAWIDLEPEDGRFAFDWLGTTLDLLGERGLQAILCTPTAAPPVWACEGYPEILPVLDNGKTLGFGGRRHACPTSPAFRRLAKRVATALGERYGRDARVLAWQIDNEVGHPFCFCQRCLEQFHLWLKARYGTVERFNEALGTSFWGQSVQDFAQIPFPNTYPNPTLWLAYHRFFSSAVIDCYAGQVDALRGSGVAAPITTNMMITWYGYDHEEMGRRLDVIAGDHYASGNTFGSDWAGEAFACAWLRSIRQGQPPWYHELQCGLTSAGLPRPGQVRQWTLGQIGFGANLLNFFRFDTAPAGAERGSYGLVQPSRQPGRIYAELQATAAEVKALTPLLEGSRPPAAKVAVLHSFDTHAAMARTPPHPCLSAFAGNGYSLEIARHFRAVAGANIPIDIVLAGGDFAGYRVIIAPALQIVAMSLAAKLEAFVRQGGTLVLTCFSGVLDENGKMFDAPVPGLLAALAGVVVHDRGPLPTACGQARLDWQAATWGMPGCDCRHWMDEVVPDAETEALATYDIHGFEGTAAITRHRADGGTVIYLGTMLAEADLRRFYLALLAEVEIGPLVALPDGVQVSVRQKDGVQLMFFTNDGEQTQRFDLPGDGWQDAVTGEVVGANIELLPGAVKMFKQHSTTRQDAK